MTPTVRWLAFSVTVVLGLRAGYARAGSPPCAFHVLQSAGAFGQTAQGREGSITRAEVNKLLAKAREAIAEGAFDRAEAWLTQAEKSNVRYTLFHRDTPKRVRRDLEKARTEGKSPKLPSERFQPRASTATQTASDDPFRAQRKAGVPAIGGLSSPAGPNLVRPVGDTIPRTPSDSDRALPEWPFGNRATGPLPLVRADANSPPGASKVRHSLGRSSVPAQDANRAHVRLAADQQPAATTSTTPAATVDRLPAPTDRAATKDGAGEKGVPSLIERTADEQQLLTRKVSADVLGRLAASRTLLQADPKRSLQLLHETRTMVASSGVETDARGQLLRRIDRGIRDAEKYIQDNRAQIELDEHNRGILEDIDRSRLLKVEVGQKLADLVEQFNQLRDERRFEEMEVVAKRARELAPDEPIVQQLWQEARFIRRIMNNRELVERKEDGVFQSLFLVEESAVPPEDGAPYRLPDAKVWEQLSQSRARRQQEGGAHRSEREMEIERKLQSPVTLEFTETPLAEVISHLMQLTSVNIHLDDRGLAEEGVTTNEPVTIKLNGEISLKSALNLILEPLHLNYMIKDEVLKITSEHLHDGETYTETYVVADLVIPIPNFTPGSHFGLQGAINDAHAALGRGTWAGGGVAPPMTLMASHKGDGGSAMINPQLLAQTPGSLTGGLAGSGVPFAAGPGGLGGGVQADFDSLIELIVNTIEPDSWDEVGGPGSVQPFETNLSLVVSQTQDVHEQIVDLLEQLRRLQDLQVTIEVRFIRLNDDFFERIGIDFDFNIVKPVSTDVLNKPVSPSATVGLVGSDPPIFTADLDIPFTQNSFAAATPAFGGFDPGSAANFGFAILSDIEAYFLVQATQGDTRSNILNAPKVTLFNGQQAFVSDTSQSPFVISVIPVVGDFAAAQQPVIVVLSEGTSLSVQAVVSPDRRYVRLTLVPLFSQIGEVDTFTFEGSSSSTRSTSSSVDEDDESVSEADDTTEVRQGTTVQLPTFAFVTVTTTVSVPDGGTVLLGGIKRLAEGRTEVGVPLLSKIPYVDRLFRNVSVGRETESLMMMVTPRIIIQEEEEERLLGVSSD